MKRPGFRVVGAPSPVWSAPRDDRHTPRKRYSVLRSFAIPSLTPRNTGSPAGACHRAAIRPTRWRAMTAGRVAPSYLATDSIFKEPIVEPSLRANGSRECAPDDRLREAIHKATRKYGLLRRFAPRNDALITRLRASRRDAPEVCIYLSPPWRAWGMPGARCTRGLVCTL